MTARRWRFRPLLTLSAAAVVALTLKLAFWQFDRAAGKRQLEMAAAAAKTAPPVTLRAAPAEAMPFMRAMAVGRYRREGEILLDNRVWRRRAGYHVITPFVFADGGAVMIKRGWLPGGGRRDIPPRIPPPPAGRVKALGVFYPDDGDAFTLSDEPADGIIRQRLRLSASARETGLPLMTLMLIREGEAADGLTPAPPPTDFKSARSVVYAWQWLTFSFLTVIFYILLSRRR